VAEGGGRGGGGLKYSATTTPAAGPHRVTLRPFPHHARSVPCSLNGILHLIDNVLLPPDVVWALW
jgi:hypothetical protein